jgi:NADH-quinone oxidoreductase subunit J
VSRITFYILLGLVFLGAMGLYGLLGHQHRRGQRLAFLGLAASAVGLAVIGIRQMGTWDTHRFYFWCFAIPALWGAIRVVSHPRPVYCAAYFLLVIVAVAGELVLANAEFLAAALVIIYAGAILVTYVFVIMLAQQGGESDYDAQAREPFAAVLVAFLLVVSLTRLLTEPLPVAVSAGHEVLAIAGQSEGNVRLMAGTLLTRYAVALEVAGVLLWVAIVGAIWLVSRPGPTKDAMEPEALVKPSGQIGREVPPF